MRPRPSSAAALAALPLAACVRVATTPLASGPALPPVPADSVRVFATQAPPHYTEIALLHTRRLLGLESDRRAMRALRERAGRLGANGVLLLNTRGAVATTGDVSGVVLGRRGGVFTGTVDTDVDEVRRAVAIRYTATPGAAPAEPRGADRVLGRDGSAGAPVP